MRAFERPGTRFLLQNLVLFTLMGVLAFFGAFMSGRSAYRSANELGAMTTDYLNIQVNSFMGQYQQILEDACYMVDAMMAEGADAAEIERWITAFSQEYDETMQYDESGLYGVIGTQAVFSSGWRPGDEYDLFTRPWYLQAVGAGGVCARSQVYEDARNGVRMVSLSKLLSDGKSVLALDIGVGEIELQWQAGSDVYPGTATVVDSEGNVLLHQQIGQEHISCELDDFTPEDYLELMAGFTGSRGYVRWDGKNDSYQHYYIVGDNGWTCIVTIPRSVIVQDATDIFYLQMGVEALFFLFIIYLAVQAYRAEKRNRQALDCFEALGRTYFCVALLDPDTDACQVTKMDGQRPAVWKNIRTRAQFLELNRHTFTAPEDEARFEETFARAELRRLCAGESESRYLEYQRRGDDGPRWVSAEAFAVHGETQRVILALREIHDAKTEELAKNQILRESLDSARMANQAKSDFLSRMSHDMRTPMNAVIGFADLARRNLNAPDKVADCLDKITAASRQLLHLINEVLDTAKIEQGKMELHLAPVDLIDRLHETAALFELQARAQHQTFTLRQPDLTHRRVVTDGNRLDQILNNLLSNALKYTPAGGSITLEAKELPAAGAGQPVFRFTVSDTGIGMAPEFLDRLFLPFEREDTSMTGQTVGVGLGMAITHNIVQMMGGRIEVESAPGKGSRFTVTLPCALPEDEGAPAALAAPAAARAGAAFTLRGLRLLLAEDNLLNREIATELLSLEGADITPAENGREAVDLFAAAEPGRFDAILMDIQMPELDGYAATREIRRQPRPDALTIPILAMTANAFEEDIAAARAAGMNGHIAKPFDLGRVTQALRDALGKEST